MRGHLRAGLMLFAAFMGVEHTAAATEFAVDPEVGNNAFTAVFDSQIGERITAVSSAVGCTLTVDEAKREGRAASLILTGDVLARAEDKAGVEVQCAGINSCKGKGSCAGASNA